MLEPINIRYSVRPYFRSVATGQVADWFGLADADQTHVIADNLQLDIQPNDLVLFTGPSGSGKSSIMRAVAQQVQVTDAADLDLPEVPLVEALTGPIPERLNWLSSCGLAEPRLMLRRPSELSEGQRYRFRLALALHQQPAGRMILLDEYAAQLDRTLAQVLSFNLRKLVSRRGVGLLLATTHEDIVDDLSPDLWVRCFGEGQIEAIRNPEKKTIRFINELWLSEGTKSDWPYFARWHYRSHHLAYVKRVVLLWHKEQPIGICVFCSPAAALSLRTRAFGLIQPRSSLSLSSLNDQLWLLSRVVLHPTYRGAGIASHFVKRACQTCPIRWIETLTALGHINPFFEKAGFRKIGTFRFKGASDRRGYSRIYGKKGTQVTQETFEKSRFSQPIYYLFDNRKSIKLPKID